MSRVFVAGATGLLGGTLVPYLRARGYEVTASVGRSHPGGGVDLTNGDLACRVLEQAQPDVIINLAALTDVDHCQRSPGEAYLINAVLVLNLVRWIEVRQAPTHLIQLSTDQVYQGPGPHREDAASPINIYAYSKCLAEEYVHRVDGTSLRTNFFGVSRAPRRASFSDWVVRSVRSGVPITVFEDVLFSPLSLPTLVQAIELVMTKRAAGTYNLGSAGGMSKADFALRLLGAAGMAPSKVKRGSIADVQFAAPRPRDMRMSSQRFEATFGLSPPELGREIDMIGGDYRDEAG